MSTPTLLLHFVLLAASLGGLAACALVILPPPRRGEERLPETWAAGWLALLLFLIYVAVILLGSLGWLRPGPMAALCVLSGAPLLPRAVRRFRDLPAALRAMKGDGGGASRLLLFCFLWTAFIALATTLPAGDFLSYHLQNIRDLLDDGSTLSVDPALLGLGAPVHYTRGMEAILSFFFLFGAVREGTALFGLAAAAILWLALRSAIRCRGRADLVFCAVLTTAMVRENILEVKNDLLIGALALLGLGQLLHRDSRARPSWPAMAAAAGLLMALKSNGIAYAALVLAAWAWSLPRRRWRRLAAALAGALPPGAYFYAVNYMRTGNPIHPFGVEIAGLELLPGAAGGLVSTTVLGSLDASLPLYMMRGALRALGPAGLALAAAAAWGAAALAAGLLRSRSSAGRGRILLGALALALVLWLATPYSDNTGHGPHGSLFSGHSLRFGFPFLFLLAAAAGGWMDGRRPAGPSRRALLLAAGACLVNLFWYDAVALVVKPGNAFHDLSPVLRTFSNGLLAPAAALLAGLAAFIAWRPSAPRVGAWLAAAVLVFHAGWPQSLGYALQFKQIGETTGAFRALVDLGERHGSISVFRTTGGTLATGIDYLLPRRFGAVHRVADPANPPPAGVYLYAVEAKVRIEGMARGRRARLTWEYMEEVPRPGGTVPVLEDRFFRIYARPDPSSP